MAAMTLREAIDHARATACGHRDMANNFINIDTTAYDHNIACAEEHEQLANWLEELLIWRQNGVKNHDCMVCIHSDGTEDYCDRPQDEEGLPDCEFEPLEELR